MGKPPMTERNIQTLPTHSILLDAGNTRIKWLVADTESNVLMPHSQQFFATADLQNPDGFTHLVQLLSHTASQFGCQDIWVCHVLGASFLQQLECAIQGLSVGLTLRAPKTGQSKHLQSLYADPSRLGQDRWMACLACLASVHMENVLHCVVSFGTATTIDAVVMSKHVEADVTTSKGATHLGGVILPGLGLMQESLYSNTAQLPKVQIQYQTWPTSTESAIASGIVRAQWSAVQSFVNDLEAQFGGNPANLQRGQCRVWVHGGHAKALLPFVPPELSARMVPLQDAVFLGLLCSLLEARA